MQGRHVLPHGSVVEIVRDLDADDGWLVLIDDVHSSYVNLRDPTHLDFEYMTWIAAIIDVSAPASLPISVLHIGGAAGSLARYVNRTRRLSTQVILEPDTALTLLMREQFGRIKGTRTYGRDGRAGLAKQAAGSTDLVIRDAFAGPHVPNHLRTTGFLDDVRRVLQPSGIYVANLADSPPLNQARREAATGRQRFRHTALLTEPSILRGRRRGNLVLVASDHELPYTDLARRTASGAVPGRLLSHEDFDAFSRDARPFEDADTDQSSNSRVDDLKTMSW